ncbi:hypothetical protein SO802_033834 [Lithocarpus litseifolius]|uniref:Uncharacterized protein n=1 Tax=Lithocarpus litseifolius TaxID=425828 RepID=A0AAW2BE84_9ROSI
MAEEEEHPNLEEPMNTQELFNTMVASQIQLREDMNRMMQQFQNLKSSQKEYKTDDDPPAVKNEKKINERMNKMEEMIKGACKMEDLMDYDSLSHCSLMQGCHPRVRCQPWISLMGLAAQSPI